MVMIVGGIVLLLLVMVIRRRRRKAVLAGINASRPVFSVEPPHRRMSGLDREAL